MDLGEWELFAQLLFFLYLIQRMIWRIVDRIFIILLASV
jgi:hypothetical protein